MAPRARDLWTQPQIVISRPMSAERREPASAERAGQVSGPERGGVGEGVAVVDVVAAADADGESTFDAAIALEERAVLLSETGEAKGVFTRVAPRRREAPKAAAAEAGGRDEDEDASAAVVIVVVEKFDVVEIESRIVLVLLAAPDRVAFGNERSWLQRCARRPRRIQRWRRAAREAEFFFFWFRLFLRIF